MTIGIDPVALQQSSRRWRIGIWVRVALVLLAVSSVVVPEIAIIVLAAPVAGATWLAWRLWSVGISGRIVVVGVLLTGSVIIFASVTHSRAENARVEALRQSIESNLTTHLALGDGPEKIEEVFGQSGLKFTYSEPLHGYYASVPTGVPDCVVNVTISVTKSKQILQISVKTFYTSL